MTKREKQTVQIASFGLREQGRIKFVLNKCKCDKLILVHSEDNKDAASDLRSELNEGGNYPVETQLVDPWHYEDVLAKVMRLAMKHRDWHLTFNPSLGTRVMTAALFWAAMFTESPVYLVVESNQRAVDVKEIHPFRRKMMTAPKREILEALSKLGSAGVRRWNEIGTRSGLRAHSISKHTMALRAWGYIEETQDKRKRITELGLVVLEASKYWK